MFIEWIRVKNFGIIKSAEHNFVDGKNFIRGGNEAGKTTLIEAGLYGMFGTSALRGTIEETVTDGAKPADLRVELKYGPYTVKRTKSSASVVGPEVKINGQANVSEFFHDMLGVRKGTENSVLISEQGKTAGILDGKPGEVSMLIESLAGFSQIDELIERIQVKFPSGNKMILEEVLENTEFDLKEKEAVVLEDPDHYINKKAGAEATLEVVKSEINLLKAAESMRKDEIAKIDASVKLKAKLTEDITELKDQMATDKTAVAVAETIFKQEVPDISDSETLVNEYPEAIKRFALYEKVTGFSWDSDEWDGDVDSLDKEIIEWESKFDDFITLRNDLQSNIKTNKRLINNEDTCPACKQDVSHLHDEINARAEKEIKTGEVRLFKVEEKIDEAKGYLKALREIMVAQDDRESFLDYALDPNTLPWSLRWVGKAPIEPSQDEFRKAQKEIANVQTIKSEIKSADAELNRLLMDMAKNKQKLEDMEQENNSLFPQDAEDLRQILVVTQSSLNAKEEEYDKYREDVQAHDAKIKELTIAIDYRDKEIETLNGKIAELNTKLSKDSRNAEILKQVRKAKPAVLNKVWGSVLASVSSTFSEMRGTESTVEKSDKGFLINGLPVHRLSGSAKSILGISVRSSLRDIFAPAAGFMCLDEPSSDCDEERKAAVTAAIAAIRGQVLVITHEDISDGSADHIVEMV
jgi:DNA repair exonuclease SbcCD ATPase subunit